MSVSLRCMFNHIKNRPLSIKLDRLPHKKLWIPNYGEFIGFNNQADGCPWDALIPGYPSLDRDVIWKSNKLLGLYSLPDGNHKIIVDLKTDEYQMSKDWLDEIKSYQEQYERENDIKGEIFLTMNGFNHN